MAKAGRPEGPTPRTQRELAVAAALWELWRRDEASRTWCVETACDLLAPRPNAHTPENRVRDLTAKLSNHAYWQGLLYGAKDVKLVRSKYWFIRASKKIIFLLMSSPNRHDAEEFALGLLDIGWDLREVFSLLHFAGAINAHSGEYGFIGPASQSFRRWLEKQSEVTAI